MVNISLERDLRRLILAPPDVPIFDRDKVSSELIKPENLGLVDLSLARKLVFSNSDYLQRDWELIRGKWGLDNEVWEWLDLPDWSARTVIESKAILHESFCGRFVSNPSFRRLFEIYQWGPKREEPTWNPHNRGEHTTAFLGLFDQGIDILWGKQRELFVKYMRKDLQEYPGTFELDDFSLYVLYKKIGMASVFLHDIATPAAGDAIKPVLIGSNGQMYDEALEVNTFLQMPQHHKLKELIDTEGLTSYYDLILDTIAGKSDTILGKLIAPIDKNKIKLDTISYLLLDGSKFNFLRHLVPGMVRSDDKEDFPSFLAKLGLVADDLVSEKVIIGGYTDALNVPLEWLNIIPSMFLTDNGDIGYADSLGLRMLLYFNTVMAFDAYQGPKMLVAEDQIQQLVRNLPLKERAALLDKDFVCTVGFREFYKRLADVMGENLLSQLYVSGSYKRYVLPKTNLADTAMKGFQNIHKFPFISFKPKTGTLTKIGETVD